jgi:hypothetical protein
MAPSKPWCACEPVAPWTPGLDCVRDVIYLERGGLPLLRLWSMCANAVTNVQLCEAPVWPLAPEGVLVVDRVCLLFTLVDLQGWVLRCLCFKPCYQTASLLDNFPSDCREAAGFTEAVNPGLLS